MDSNVHAMRGVPGKLQLRRLLPHYAILRAVPAISRSHERQRTGVPAPRGPPSDNLLHPHSLHLLGSEKECYLPLRSATLILITGWSTHSYRITHTSHPSAPLACIATLIFHPLWPSSPVPAFPNSACRSYRRKPHLSTISIAHRWLHFNNLFVPTYPTDPSMRPPRPSFLVPA